MKLKKILLSLGTIASVAAPVAAVVACGAPDSSQYSEEDLLRMSNLKSSEAHAKLQDLWLSKVLMSEYKVTNKEPLEFLQTIEAGDFETDFKRTLEWVLKDQLFASKDALTNIYKSIRTNAPAEIAGDSNTESPLVAVKALDKKIFNRSDIESAVDAVMSDDSWEKVFYNYTVSKDKTITFNPSILGIKDIVLKMMITKKYMEKDSEDFKNVLPNEYAKLDDKFKDITLIKSKTSNFPLLVSATNLRLAYKSSIEIAENKSRQFIIANDDNNFADKIEAMNTFQPAPSKAIIHNIVVKRNGKSLNRNTSSNPKRVKDKETHKFLQGTTTQSQGITPTTSTSYFNDALTYTQLHETMVNSIMAKQSLLNIGSIGFKGIDTLPTGSDTLDVSSADAIKLVTDPFARDGFIVKDEIVTKDIRYTDEDKTKVELNYYESLMPTYDTTDKTLKFHQSIDKDILENVAYGKDKALYTNAVKYFTAASTDVNKKEPILIEVTNDWARNYYLDEGLEYIDDEK